MTQQNQRPLRIGEIAARAGVNPQTLRFYEREGLLPPPRREPSGYRAYPPEAVQAVKFIKHAQGLGYTLGEISILQSWTDGAPDHCSRTRDLTRRRIAETERAIAHLVAIRDSLRDLVAECESTAPAAEECPVSRAIDESTRWPVPLSEVDCPHLQPTH